jgi:hypothetical protein
MSNSTRTKVVAIPYAIAAIAAAVPWLISGATAPLLVGGGAVVSALLFLCGIRIAGPVLIIMAALILFLLAIEYLSGGPGMAPLEIGGVPFRGSLFALPIVVLVGPFAYFVSKPGSKEERP